MERKIASGSIELVQGDITQMNTDAIVNPSNTELILGAGVSGAIRMSGGETIQEQMNALGGCPVGRAKVTYGGDLPTQHVIHAVGPMMGEGDEDEKLRSATSESLKCAEELGIQSIAFPAISTGVYGFPVGRCAQIMLSVAIDHLHNSDIGCKKVVFCLWGDEAFNVFKKTLDLYEP